MIPTQGLYSFQSGDRTLYLHADNFEHAREILLDAVDSILAADMADRIGQLVSVIPDTAAGMPSVQ